MLSVRAIIRAAAWGAVCCCACPLAAQVTVQFDQPKYFVTGPGDTVEVSILVDGVDSTEPLNPVRRGLYSFAVKTTFDGAKAQVDNVGEIDPAAELDYFGLGVGAFEALGLGFGAVKGNIRQQTNPLEPYEGTLLAKLTLTNLAAGPDSYPLRLEFFRTVGPNEQFFLDGAGAVLDGQIEFGEALVVVIPEPTAGALAALGLAGLAWAAARRRSSPRRRRLATSGGQRIHEGAPRAGRTR
jgi:hypothetical protein